MFLSFLEVHVLFGKWFQEIKVRKWGSRGGREENCPQFQFSRSVVSDSLRPHEPQHARPPCPSPIPGVHPNPCPLCRWCHPAISSSVVPLSCPQSFPASGSLQISQLSASGGQSIGVSASTSVLSMNTQDWSPLGELTVERSYQTHSHNMYSKITGLDRRFSGRRNCPQAGFIAVV